MQAEAETDRAPRKVFFSSLPTEIVGMVFENLDVHDILQMRQVRLSLPLEVAGDLLLTFLRFQRISTRFPGNDMSGGTFSFVWLETTLLPPFFFPNG